MKKLWVSVLILITIIVVAGCGGGGNNTDPVGTLQVESIINLDQEPLSGVSVKVIGSANTYEGKSDANGKVTINSIPVGTYNVRYAIDGKATVYKQMTLTASTNTVQQIRLLTWNENDHAGWRWGVVDANKCNLTGLIVTANDKNLPDVSVTVSPGVDKIYYLGCDSNGTAILDLNASMTDGSGKFYTRLSPKTKYTITASDKSNHSFDPIEITIPDEPCMFDLTIRAK